MLKRETKQPLNSWQEKMIMRPVFYRLKFFDFLLPGFILMALVVFIFKGDFTFSECCPRNFFLGSFILILVIINRGAFLISGRGRVVNSRVVNVVGLLLSDEPFSLVPFALQTRIELPLLLRSIEEIMANRFYQGFLDIDTLVLTVVDNPLENKTCPTCSFPLPETIITDKVCAECGTIFYI